MNYYIEKFYVRISTTSKTDHQHQKSHHCYVQAQHHYQEKIPIIHQLPVHCININHSHHHDTGEDIGNNKQQANLSRTPLVYQCSHTCQYVVLITSGFWRTLVHPKINLNSIPLRTMPKRPPHKRLVMVPFLKACRTQFLYHTSTSLVQKN